jgi:hypothetical protein
MNPLPVATPCRYRMSVGVSLEGRSRGTPPLPAQVGLTPRHPTGELGHLLSSSRFAWSLKPSVAYLVLNFCEGWKKQITLPSLA